MNIRINFQDSTYLGSGPSPRFSRASSKESKRMFLTPVNLDRPAITFKCPNKSFFLLTASLENDFLRWCKKMIFFVENTLNISIVVYPYFQKRLLSTDLFGQVSETKAQLAAVTY
jgi:hypothetical protein